MAFATRLKLLTNSIVVLLPSIYARTVRSFVLDDIGIPLQHHRTHDEERLKRRLSLTTG
ncbi:hypothetical protein [Dickeya sp. NCPPB 3274]|uniref:hypothetical protein n=1 Tax=Dickeya sp. NCPPB 3274 TaxID=568766 RepID=UPI001EE688A3|nr:hypothetical protein [Dickeya sp. NCPPB 3274]